MGTLLLPPPNCVLPTQPVVIRSALKLSHSKPTIYRREIADGLLDFAPQSGVSQSSISSIRCEANRRGRPRRNNPVNRNAKEGDDLKDPPISNSETSKTSNQDEILSLFRRIRSSIAKGESVASRRRSLSDAKGKEKPTVKSIQRHTNRKQVRAPREEIEREATLSKIPTSEGDEQAKKDSPDPVNNAKLSRPASNFVKRSPIPPPPTPRKTNNNAADEQSPTEIPKEASETLKLEEMKLVELKELAKEKGVKGYSRLKKGELIELLKGLVQTS